MAAFQTADDVSSLHSETFQAAAKKFKTAADENAGTVIHEAHAEDRFLRRFSRGGHAPGAPK